MNKHPFSSRPKSKGRPVSDRAPSRRAGAARGIVISAIVLATAVGAWKLPMTQNLLAEYWPAGDETEDAKYILHTAKKSPFRITITENGTIDSLQNATLTNTVEGSTTIISLVSEGSRVNAPVESEIDGVVEFVENDSESDKTILVRSEDGTEKTYNFSLGPFTEVLVEDRAKIKKGEYIAGDMVCELDSSILVEKEKQLQIDVTTARADLEKATKNLEIQ